MSYIPTVWKSGDIVSSEKLNKLEQGVADATSESIIVEETDAWLEENIAQETGYALDSSLTMSNAAAPADKVGELKTAINQIATVGTTVSKNLYNPNDPDYKAGYRASNSTGLPTEDSAWNLTGFIPLAYSNNIVISRRGTSGTTRDNATALTRIYAYREDKTTFISATYNTGITYYTAPENCAYIRCAVSSNASFTDYQIEYGTTITDYEPYSPSSGSIIPTDDFVSKIKTSKLDNDAEFLNEEALVTIPSIEKCGTNLPSVIYGFVNVPMRIYPYNIMQYAPDDVYVRYVTSNKGKALSDAWEYTPISAENFTHKTLIYDHSIRKLNEESRQVQIKSSSAKSSLKVLVIGDSTVQAGTETEKLLALASGDNYSVTLLGTRGTSPNLNEGRGGWTATMYAHSPSNVSGTVENAFYNPSTELFDFSYYMNQQSYSGVDCVFIQLGINDIFEPKDSDELETAIETYIADMDIIIGSIHTYDSDIKIVVNTIFPSDTNQDSFGEEYGVTQTVWRYRQNVYQANKELIEHYNDQINVYVSWFGASIDVNNNMGGDVHPTTNGYNQLGTQMYGVMRAIN